MLAYTHFRRPDLAYLDGAEPAPEFQRDIAYTFHRFGRVAADWPRADELTEKLVLPAVRHAVGPQPYYDVLALILETRFLRPLVGFGMAAERRLPRETGNIQPRATYRTTPLFDRTLRFG